MSDAAPPLPGIEFSTLVELLQQRSRHLGGDTAFIFLENGETESDRLTYRQLHDRATTIAANLQQNCFIGDRALLLYPPGLEFIAAFFGCLYAGIIAIPVYPPRRNQTLLRLQSIVADSQATLALTDTVTLNTIEKRFGESDDMGKLNWLATDAIAVPTREWKEPTLTPPTLAYLQYTSGSTGTPKGVMVTHENLLVNLEAMDRIGQHRRDDIILTWLPTFHDMGLIYGVFEPIYKGIACYMMPPAAFLQRPRRWLQAISRYGATHSGGPNFAYHLCARKTSDRQRQDLDLSRWRMAFNGAEPVRAEVLTNFARQFAPCGFAMGAFSPCYGLAEATLQVTIVPAGIQPTFYPVSLSALGQNRIEETAPEESRQVLVGCGRSEMDTEVAIVDPQTCQRCQPQRVGEIWVRGATVARGYWRQTEATEATFQARLATGEGPFLRTGDLGFLREGELFVTGRLKDAIIVRGRNHYPQDIELTVEECNEALRPSCGAAFGVQVEGEERLVVVQEVERSHLRKLDVDEVVGDIRQAVAAEHELQTYAIVLLKTTTIPKTSSGKIQRQRTRQLFLSGDLEVVADWGENPQFKSDFVHLQEDINSTLKQLKLRSLR